MRSVAVLLLCSLALARSATAQTRIRALQPRHDGGDRPLRRRQRVQRPPQVIVDIVATAQARQRMAGVLPSVVPPAAPGARLRRAAVGRTDLSGERALRTQRPSVDARRRRIHAVAGRPRHLRRQPETESDHRGTYELLHADAAVRYGQRARSGDSVHLSACRSRQRVDDARGTRAPR